MPLKPKARFLEQNALAHVHEDVVTSESFLTACESAMLQMIVDLPETTDTGTAAAAYQRISGAKQFLNQLLTLADIPKPPEKRPAIGQLDHKA